MRSVSSTPVVAVIALAGIAGLVFVLFGLSHTTTQQTSERLGVDAKRDLTGQKPIPTAPRDRAVKVVHSSIVRAGGSAALVAVLRNAGSAPVNDLPIAAGVAKGNGEPDYANVKGSSYFQSHAPAIEPGEEATWVLSGPKLGAGAAAVTVVRPNRALPTQAESLPTLDVNAARAVKGAAVAQVTNTSDVPQYKLEVYAWARRGARYVAAGHGELAFLDGGRTATVHVPLVGDPKGARIHVSVPPTIFR